MKTMYKILFFIVLIPKMGFANDENHAYNKEKTISKTYNVNADAQINVSNSYGNVNVYLWDENKISIQVSIKVSGNNENKVNDKLSEIDVDFSASQSLVSAKTTFGNANWKGGNLSYEINYIVKLPMNGSVDIINKYGNIAIDKLMGSSNITCHYGSINLGDFNNKSNNINIAYSNKSSIHFIDKVNLKSQYSDIDIQKVNQIEINGNYNDFEFQSIGSLDINSNYSKIKANSIQKVIVDGNYLTLKLGEIGKSVAVSSNYSDVRLSASNKTDGISIIGNYTNSKITCNQDYAFDIDVTLKYGSFNDDVGIKYSEKSEKNTSFSCTGYHISQGKSKIKVITNYGSVQLLTK